MRQALRPLPSSPCCHDAISRARSSAHHIAPGASPIPRLCRRSNGVGLWKRRLLCLDDRCVLAQRMTILPAILASVRPRLGGCSGWFPDSSVPSTSIGPVARVSALSSGLTEEGPSYHTVYAIGGPWTTSEWFMAGSGRWPGADVGHARARDSVAVVSTGGDLCFDDLPFLGSSGSVISVPGLAGSVQGYRPARRARVARRRNDAGGQRLEYPLHAPPRHPRGLAPAGSLTAVEHGHRFGVVGAEGLVDAPRAAPLAGLLLRGVLE